MDLLDLNFRLDDDVSISDDGSTSSHPLYNVEQSLLGEMNQLEKELHRIEKGEQIVKNKTRKRQRLLGKKEKMKVQLQLVYRNIFSPTALTPKDKKDLYNLAAKYTSDNDTDSMTSEREDSATFLYRVLCENKQEELLKYMHYFQLCEEDCPHCNYM